MSTKKQTNGLEWISGKNVMTRNMADPDFRYHYEQRRMVHEIALAVRRMRKNAGMTQSQLARSIGVKQPMIARIERGTGSSRPSWSTLHRIGISLGMQLKLSFATGLAAEPTALVELDGRTPTVDVDEQPMRKAKARHAESASSSQI